MDTRPGACDGVAFKRERFEYGTRTALELRRLSRI